MAKRRLGTEGQPLTTLASQVPSVAPLRIIQPELLAKTLVEKSAACELPQGPEDPPLAANHITVLRSTADKSLQHNRGTPAGPSPSVVLSRTMSTTWRRSVAYAAAD